MFHKVRMPGEVVVLAVLKYEDAVGSKEVVGEDEIGNLWKFLQGVGRVGKDEVKLLMTALDQAEDIGAKTLNIIFFL